MNPLALELPDELVEQVAERVAAILGGDLDLPGDSHGRCDGYLDVAGAADFLACPTSRIYSLVSAKRIPHHRDGSRLLFDSQELRQYVLAGGAKRP